MTLIAISSHGSKLDRILGVSYILFIGNSVVKPRNKLKTFPSLYYLSLYYL